MATVAHVDAAADSFCKIHLSFILVFYFFNIFGPLYRGTDSDDTSTLEKDLWDLNRVQQTARRSPPVASADRQVRSAWPGVTEGDASATEKEEREMASEMALKMPLCQVFFCHTYNLRIIVLRYDFVSLGRRRSETVVKPSRWSYCTRWACHMTYSKQTGHKTLAGREEEGSVSIWVLLGDQVQSKWMDGDHRMSRFWCWDVSLLTAQRIHQWVRSHAYQ